MIMYQNFIGIDISKDTFCTAVYGADKTRTYQNSEKGFDEFRQQHTELLSQSLIILETTGGYEMALIRNLQKHDCFVHRANTRKVKHYIRSFGQLGKTDAIDAIALAQYAFDRHEKLDIFVENISLQLLQLVRRRNDLKQMLVQEKNRLKAPEHSELKNSFQAIINVLQNEIDDIQSQIDEIYKVDAKLLEKKNVLKSVDGIGDIIATELLALIPELGTIDRKKIASLGGVAPHPNESGKKIGYRFTRGGRAEIKPVLFMAAMSASRGHSELGKFYRKLIEAGKKKMVAMTALMRKILVIANARMRDFLSERPTQTT